MSSYRFPQLQFDYRDPEKNFDRSKVHGLVAKLVKIKDVSTATALEVSAGGKVNAKDGIAIPDQTFFFFSLLYYNLVHNKVPQYLSSFLPNTSLATNRYPIRHPRLQPPFHSHAFISQTCKYNLPVLLNSINNQSDELTVIVRNVDNTSLSGFKKATKSYLLSKYSYECSIPNCYICQI